MKTSGLILECMSEPMRPLNVGDTVEVGFSIEGYMVKGSIHMTLKLWHLFLVLNSLRRTSPTSEQ